MNIELTQAQAQELLACLDLAIKAGGIRTATVAMPLVAMIHLAAEEVAEEKGDDTASLTPSNE
jgi:hypothetical protein